MNEKPIIKVALHAGQYLVDVHPAYKPRVWKHLGDGVFVGHGSKLKRAAIAYAFNDLVMEAEAQEGIREAWKPPSKENTETYNITVEEKKAE